MFLTCSVIYQNDYLVHENIETVDIFQKWEV